MKKRIDGLRAKGESLVLILLATLIFASTSVVGQDAQEAQSEPDAQALIPLTEAESLVLDQLLDNIESDKAIIDDLSGRMETAEGIEKSIIYSRLDRVTGKIFRSVLDLGSRAIKHQNDGKNAERYKQVIEEDLVTLPREAFDAVDRVGLRINYKRDDLTTVELVNEDQRLFAAVKIVDEIYQLLLDYLTLADAWQLDVDEVRERLRQDMKETAASRSVFLDMAIAAAANHRASAVILPANTVIAGELSAADARVKLTAASLQRSANFLRVLGVDDRLYRQQILAATGQITTEVLDVGVFTNLVKNWSSSLWQMVVDQGPRLLLNLFLMILIVYLATRVSRLAEMGINRALDSSRVQISHLLRRMLVSTGRNLVVMLGILIALAQVGISLGPLLAGLGIAGFIIGFAMQDALSNFASGMLILFYRPFDVGDTVEAGGVRGKVRSMSLVNTTIMTFDNQALVVPNNLIWGSVIKNVTAQRTRRVDLTFGISYGDDILNAERVFREIVTAHEKVLDSPEPMIHVNELGDSSVNFIVRPWVRTEDYWDVYWDITRDVKLRLDKEGISIPFPQRDVHVHETKPA